MDAEIGYVVKILGDRSVIRMHPGEGCNAGGCQHSCASHGSKARQIIINNLPGVREGEKVLIRYHEKTRLISGVILFIFPVIMGFAGYFLGLSVSGREQFGILGTIIGFAASFIFIWIINNLIFEKKRYVPTIEKIESQASFSTRSAGHRHSAENGQGVGRTWSCTVQR